MIADNNFYTKKSITKTINNEEVTVIVYTIDINTPLYRGDNNIAGFEDKNILKGDYKFFTPDETAAEQYGVVYNFETTKELIVVALDDITEGFYNSASKDIQNILNKNYGYNNNKLRDSDVKADSELIAYLCKNHFDGYATNFMNIGGIGGRFHKEVVLCNPETVVKTIGQITNEEEAKAKREKARNKRISEVQEKPKRQTNVSGLSGTNLFGDDSDSDDDSAVKRLFGGKKRKTNKRRNTKKRAKSNKRRNTKKRAKSNKRRNTKK